MSSRVSAPNNFDTLRLLLAATVAVYHQAVLSRRPELAFLRSPAAADFAVKGFFVVSGFLVTQSLRQSRSLGSYFEKRARRLLPGYVAVVLLGFVAGACLTSWPLAEFLSAPDTWRHLLWNALFLNYKAMTLPGVFQGPDHPFFAVNGSLWTIKVEVAFYILLPLILLAVRRVGLWPVAVALYVGGVAWRYGMTEMSTGPDGARYAGLATHLPGQLAYFACGIVAQMVNPSRKGLLQAGAVALGVLLLTGPVGRALAEPALYAALVLGLALHLPYLGNASRFGDFSYGLYLIHFPLLQSMIALGMLKDATLLPTLTFAVLLAAGAWLSWTLVEKPFLRRKPRGAPSVAAASNVAA